MKSSQLIAFACCLGSALASPGQSTPIMRDAVTHDQLVAGQRQAQQQDPMRSLAVATGEDPSLKNRPADLLKRSDVISFNGLATLVPKRAILSIPENLKNRLSEIGENRLVSWSEFYAANRAWITTEEVTYDQAAGAEKLPEKTTARLVKSANLVVATYLGGPISVAALAVASTSPQPQN